MRMKDVLHVSQGQFRVKRRLDGAVVIECPPVMVVDPGTALAIAKSILQEAGVPVTEIDRRKLAC